MSDLLPQQTASYLVKQIATLRREIAELKAQRVTYLPGEVTDTDTTGGTFSALVAGMVDGDTVPLSGITAPSSFLPTVGDTVLIALSGAQPIYQPGRIGAGSVGTVEIADGAITTGQLADASVSQQKLTFDLADYSGNSIFYGSTTPQPPAVGFSVGDLWLQTTGNTGSDGEPAYIVFRYDLSGQWVRVQDQGIADSLANALAAQQAADAKATLFTQATAPTYTGAANTAYWIDTSSGGGNAPKVWNGTAWVIYQLGNGAIQPNSLIASDVIATGTVTAALMEAQLVLTTDLIAGDPNGTHALMAPDGLHIYDSADDEVIRLGTTDNDYFGVVDSSGDLKASIDEAGGVNCIDLNCTNTPVFAGRLLDDTLGDLPQGVLARGNLTGARIDNITNTFYGLFEIAMIKNGDRTLEVKGGVWTFPTGTATELYIGIFYTTDGTSPTTSSPLLRSMSLGAVAASTFDLTDFTFLIRTTDELASLPDGATGRFLLAVKAGAAGATLSVEPGLQTFLSFTDVGQGTDNLAVTNTGGGSTTPPPQQHDTGNLGPTAGPGVGYWTFRGDGTLRTDTTEVIQGLDPSGNNGDGQGMWKFAIPVITGTVNRVDVYIYADWTYYNSGGRVILGLTTDYGVFNPTKIHSGWDSGRTYPKPGGLWVTLPNTWYGAFNNKSSIGVTVGPGGSNETFYVRMAGAATRIRIWYTQ